MSGNTRTFGPYALVRRLGAGGMAETFEGVRSGPGGFEQRVCVKRILPEVSDDPNFVRLFREEARVAARLRHANIVQLLDVGVVDGAHYLTLELVEGCDLRRLLQFERARQGFAPGTAGGGLTSGIVAFLAMELATALEVAHGGATAIVHRDISPSNVLLSTAGEVKLADFGIARAITDNLATRTQAVRGKVPYMAPEYALRGVVDRRVDLFALGVLLYEALAGVRPFDGRSDVETLNHLEQGLHTPLAERCPGAPAALVEAIEQLIVPVAEARTASATALLDALVDVAPPPTARRILGELVAQVARGLPPAPITADAIDPLAATSHAATPTRGAVEASAPITTDRDPMPPAYATTTVSPGEAVLASQTRTPAAPRPTEARTAVLTDAAHLPARVPARPFAAAPPEAPTRTAFVATREPATETHAPLALHDPLSTSVDAAPRATDDAPTTAEPALVAPREASTERRPVPPPGRWRRAPLALAALALGGASLTFVALRPRARTDGARPHPASHAASLPASSATRPAAPDAPASPRALATAPGVVAALPEGAPPTTAPGAAHLDAPGPVAPRPRTASAPSNVRETRPGPPEARRETILPSAAGTPASRGLLTVVSDPGQTIFLDGRPAGEGPLTMPLAPGRHVLTAGDGPEAPSLAVDLAPGERRRVVLR